jgi:hypothetical protein
LANLFPSHTRAAPATAKGSKRAPSVTSKFDGVAAREVIQQTWSVDPSVRPSFDQILSCLSGTFTRASILFDFCRRWFRTRRRRRPTGSNRSQR